MTDYFKCLACGAVVSCRYNEWPRCDCHDPDTMYSHDVTNDFDTATEEEYDEWMEENEE